MLCDIFRKCQTAQNVIYSILYLNYSCIFKRLMLRLFCVHVTQVLIFRRRYSLYSTVVSWRSHSHDILGRIERKTFDLRMILNSSKVVIACKTFQVFVRYNMLINQHDKAFTHPFPSNHSQNTNSILSCNVRNISLLVSLINLKSKEAITFLKIYNIILKIYRMSTIGI